MAGSPYLKHFPFMFWCLTGLDIKSRRFNYVIVLCTLASNSAAVLTSVYRLFKRGLHSEILRGTALGIVEPLLFLIHTAVLILKKDKIIILIESVLMPFADYESDSWNSETLENHKKWVNRVGVFLIFNVFFTMCCIVITLSPLMWAFFITEGADIQDLPLPFGWIPFPTDSYLVYALAYTVSASSVVLGGGLATACYLLLVYSALGIRTMLRLLAEDWAGFEERVDLLVVGILVSKDSPPRRRKDKGLMEAIRLDCISTFLKRSVDKHVEIIGHVRTLDRCFSVYIMVYCQLCVLVSAMAIPQIMTRGLADIEFFFAVNLVNTAFFCGGLVCLCGQIILDESASLHRALYECPWTDRHQTFKSCLLIIMSVATRPLYLTAGGTSPFTMATFTTAMQAVYSYVNLLLTLKN